MSQKWKTYDSFGLNYIRFW